MCKRKTDGVYTLNNFIRATVSRYFNSGEGRPKKGIRIWSHKHEVELFLNFARLLIRVRFWSKCTCRVLNA